METCNLFFRVDNAFLVSLVGLRPEKYFWIGLSNRKHIDSFVWTNTDTVRFTHWNSEMPGMEKVVFFLSVRYFRNGFKKCPSQQCKVTDRAVLP